MCCRVISISFRRHVQDQLCMKRRYLSLAAHLAFTLILFGCTDRNAGSGSSNVPGSYVASPTPATDEWLGQWNGPEGTFIRLEGGKGTYEITIQDLEARKPIKEVPS